MENLIANNGPVTINWVERTGAAEDVSFNFCDTHHDGYYFHYVSNQELSLFQCLAGPYFGIKEIEAGCHEDLERYLGRP